MLINFVGLVGLSNQQLQAFIAGFGGLSHLFFYVSALAFLGYLEVLCRQTLRG